jgi:hypothetical protein
VGRAVHLRRLPRAAKDIVAKLIEDAGFAAGDLGSTAHGDVAMPLREAYEFYGTPRGAVDNYVNGFAVQSLAYTTPFDAQQAAARIRVPFLLVHSEHALAPPLARKFYATVDTPKAELWLESQGQIDFYDEPGLINPAVDAIAEYCMSEVIGNSPTHGVHDVPAMERPSLIDTTTRVIAPRRDDG